ncbi:MAG: protein kinase [Polyangiaceae bacterium]
MADRTEEIFAGKFRMVKMLGRGAMGEVWLAEEVGPRNFRRQVAVKRLLVTEGISEVARESFVAEAQVIARLDHPNIVRLIELGESDDRGLYLVLDYIDGAALDRVIKRGGPLSPNAVALIGREISRALDAVHSMCDERGANLHVVHRDVSPANILIGRDGRIRLSDFGVARIHGLGGEKTETGVFKGKLPYMPPEQALGQPFDGRADVFSLGVTLFEALLGGRLRKAETQGQLIAMIATEEVARVHEVIPQVMPELARAIDSATMFDATQRVPSAGHLAMELQNVLYRLGPQAEEAASREICERVAATAGAPMQAPRQPWSVNLGETGSQPSASPMGYVPSISSTTSPSATSYPSVPTPSTGFALPASAPTPDQASVTKIASFTDTTRSATNSGSSTKTWLLALTAATLIGVLGAVAFVFFFNRPAKSSSNASTAPDRELAASNTAANTTRAEPPGGSPTSPTASSANAPSGSVAVASPKPSDTAATARPTSAIVRPTASADPDPGSNTGTGTLIVSVNPWGNVTVDGRPYGQTPMGAITLPAGTHSVTVTNPELGATRSGSVKVVSGKQASIGFDLRKSE